MRELSSIPVLGFETSGCHCASYNTKSAKNRESYIGANAVKIGGCVPLLGGIPAGLIWIDLGMTVLKGKSSSENLGDVEYPKLKGAALITRGIVTILGGGILFGMADVATTVGRAAKAQLLSNQ